MNDANMIYQQKRIDHTRQKFDRLQIGDLKGKSYLDLGCNAGMFCRFAVDAGAAPVAGVDIDPKLVTAARQNVPEAEFSQFRFEEIDLGRKTFDVITIASAIHYSRDFLTVANKIIGMLNSGGLLVIEGGVFDPAANTKLNAPIPAWRKIGDHCRQLSMNFISDVLFPGLDVKLVGPSLNQGGDNLARYVVQVHKNDAINPKPAKGMAKVDLEAFIRGIAVSFDTTDPKYPISGHMEAISKAALMGPGQYATHLGSPALVDLIAKEIEYCVLDWASAIEIVDVYASELGGKLREHLKAAGYSVS